MTSLTALRTRIERAYANERAEVMHRVDGPTPRDVSTWLAGVSFGECVALFEALAAAEAERDAYRAALEAVPCQHPIRICGSRSAEIRGDADCVRCVVLAAPVQAAPPTKETP